jgi:UDP:flavonoid glycosyltransferase YjiC (YdhE family)
VPTLAALMLGDLTMVTDTPEILGVPRDTMEQWRPATSRRPSAWRPDTRLVYTGPLFAQLDQPISERVQAFLQGSRPVAYVVLSSATPELLRAVVARVRAAGVRVLVGATIHDYGPVQDPDVLVEGILPSHQIMPQVDVAVTMGGQGTVQTAMASGTPLVAIPLHAEQELNVALAARVGMAIAVAPRHAHTERLTRAVRQVLSQPHYAAGAQRAKHLYRNQDGAAQAAEQLLRKR